MTVPIQTVQSSVASGAASITVTIAATSPGDQIFVLCPIQVSTGGVTFAMTDNQGNTYTKRVDTGNGSNHNQSMIWDCLTPVTSAVTSIVLTPTGGTVFGSITATTFVSGTVTGPDQSGSHTQTTPANGPIVATATSVDTGTADLVLACMNEQGSGAGDNPTTPAGYTQLSTTTSGGVSANQTSYRFNTSAVTDSASWTWSGGATSASSAIASYTAASVLPAGPGPMARQIYVMP